LSSIERAPRGAPSVGAPSAAGGGGASRTATISALSVMCSRGSPLKTACQMWPVPFIG
jgi:hypothetical protein